MTYLNDELMSVTKKHYWKGLHHVYEPGVCWDTSYWRKARDVSDKIKGFLYQDLLAIDLILNSNDEDRIYVEWIEDIFLESLDLISIYQVKHYPESYLGFQDIYIGMFYQNTNKEKFKNLQEQ